MKSLDRKIIALAVPMILSNITVPLLGMVDTAVIGHLPHAYYLGGSTVGAMIITFITWLCGFLRMSTTGLAAQALGRQNSDDATLVLLRGLMVAAAIGLVCIVLQTPYFQLSLWLAGGSEQVQFYAKQYMDIRVWGLPAALANIVMLGWLLGQHQAKAVMWLLILINSINLSLDLLFVLAFNWQVQGVAAATLVAEYSGLMAGLGFILHRYYQASISQLFSRKVLTEVMNVSQLAAYFKLNRDILIRTLCLEVCFVFMTFQGARLGDNVVAANAILMNFLLLISFGLDGIANAAEAMIGKAKGAGANNELALILKRCTLWTLVFALAYSTAFALAGDWLINQITSITDVRTEAEKYLGWIVLLPLIGCWCYLYDGVYVGMTRADIMRNSMIVATFAVFFPLWWLFQGLFSQPSFIQISLNHALWLAFSGFMLARGATLGWHLYRRLLPQSIATSL
ncbi:MATE family efflux transporter [Thalassotalea montiporae]